MDIQHRTTIIFADQLRGFAAILVLMSHWFGVFWGMRETVSRHISAPIIEGANPLAYDIISINPEFGLGPLGVSIFFLISGFVIPISLERKSVRSFLIARFFRIFPTYWLCLFLGLSAVFLSSVYWQKKFPWKLEEIFSNSLLLNDLFNIPSIDLVNWTLAVEFKFYIVICVLSFWIKSGKIGAVFIFSLLIVLFNTAAYYSVPFMTNIFLVTLVGAFTSALTYVLFMLIGIFFYFHYKNQLSFTKLVISLIAQLSLFLVAWYFSAMTQYFPVVPKIYVVGLFCFFIAYFLRNKCSPHVVIDWIARISFPLYLTHSMIGYVFITILMSLGFSFYFSVLVSLVLVCIIAHLIHIYFEKPTNQFGKRLANI
jgi:peptidoglycan/LPS O-acetylase OafA/YrhL